jgi:hypothetical protein
MEHSDLLQRLSLIAPEPNPALFEHARERAESVQNRISDRWRPYRSLAVSYLFSSEYDA